MLYQLKSFSSCFAHLETKLKVRSLLYHYKLHNKYYAWLSMNVMRKMTNIIQRTWWKSQLTKTIWNMSVMDSVQEFISETVTLDINQGLLREPGCCAGTVGLMSGGVMRCLVCLLNIILYYIYLYKYMTCLISCIMINGHEIK
jgi:hypothetical protein